MRKWVQFGAAVAVALGATASAEVFDEPIEIGSISLSGLARESWPLNPPGEQFAMVCQTGGPKESLAIHGEPRKDSTVRRRLLPLAIVTIDTSEQEGAWVRVLDAHRTHSVDGLRIGPKDLSVTGWAHSDYLCDFLD